MKLTLQTQQVTRLTKIFTALFLLLIGYVVIANTVLIPQAIANNYAEQLAPSYNALSVQFKALSKSSELPAYNDPYSDVQTARTDLLATQKLIASTERTLASYEQQANMLPTSSFAPLSTNFKKAQVTKSKSDDVFSQSKEVIFSYEQLTNYLLQITDAKIAFMNSTAEVNGLTNLNILRGQSDIVAARANQLRDTITSLKSITPPSDFAAYHASTITSYQQALAGLDQLTLGLRSANDAQISSGAYALEQAIKQYESTSDDLFNQASTNSPVIENVSMLVDKIDSLRPFADE